MRYFSKLQVSVGAQLNAVFSPHIRLIEKLYLLCQVKWDAIYQQAVEGLGLPSHYPDKTLQ